MGNDITDWVIQKWAFPLPGAYQSFLDLYLSMIMFLILIVAALMELCQNLFSSVSWFSLNAWGIHLPSPPVLILGSWRAPSQDCATILLQSPCLRWRHQWLSHLHVHGLLSQDESLCSSIGTFAERPGPTRRTWLPTFTQGPVQHTAPTKSLRCKQKHLLVASLSCFHSH